MVFRAGAVLTLEGANARWPNTAAKLVKREGGGGRQRNSAVEAAVEGRLTGNPDSEALNKIRTKMFSLPNLLNI
jgi:hypothetical protein